MPSISIFQEGLARPPTIRVLASLAARRRAPLMVRIRRLAHLGRGSVYQTLLHRETWVVLNYALGNDERSLPKASAARLTDMMGFYTCQRASCDLPLRQRTRHARPTRIRTLTAPWLMTISRLRRLRSPLSSRPPAKKRSNRRGSPGKRREQRHGWPTLHSMVEAGLHRFGKRGDSDLPRQRRTRTQAF